MIDAEIIKYLKYGKDKDLYKVYDLYKSEFFRYLKRYNLPEEQVWDIYQDAFIVLRENAQKNKLNELNSSVKTYFFAIGKYMALAEIRRNGKSVLMDSMEDFEWDESDLGLERDDERQNETSIKIMQKALNQIGGKCKEILKLFYYQEMKLDEIVETMSYENKDFSLNSSDHSVSINIDFARSKSLFNSIMDMI